jgi:hypothetical protein
MAQQGGNLRVGDAVGQGVGGLPFALIPFGGHPDQERRVGGYTIPTQAGVGWWYGTER